MQSSGLSNEDLKDLIAENAKASKSILKLVQANAKAIEALSDKIDKYVDSTNKSLQDLINVVVQLHTRVEEVSPAKKADVLRQGKCFLKQPSPEPKQSNP